MSLNLFRNCMNFCSLDSANGFSSGFDLLYPLPFGLMMFDLLDPKREEKYMFDFGRRIQLRFEDAVAQLLIMPFTFMSTWQCSVR